MNLQITDISLNVKQWLELINLIYSVVNLIIIYNFAYYALYQHLSNNLGYRGFKKSILIKFNWFLIFCIFVELAFNLVPINKIRTSSQPFKVEWSVILIADSIKLIILAFMQIFSYWFIANENDSRLETTQNSSTKSISYILSTSMRRACRFSIEIKLQAHLLDKKFQHKINIEYDLEDELIRQKTSFNRRTRLRLEGNESIRNSRYGSQQMEKTQLFKTSEELLQLARKLRGIQETSQHEGYTELFSGNMDDVDLRLLQKYINLLLNLETSEIRHDSTKERMVSVIFHFLGFNPKVVRPFIPNLFLIFDFQDDFRVSVEKMETLFQHYVVTDLRQNLTLENSFNIYFKEIANESEFWVTRSNREISDLFVSLFPQANFPVFVNLTDHKLQMMYILSLLFNEHIDLEAIQNFLELPQQRLPDVQFSVADFFLDARPLLGQYERVEGYDLSISMRGFQTTISRQLDHFKVLCNHLSMRFGEDYKWQPSNFQNPKRLLNFIQNLISTASLWRSAEFMLFMDHIPEDIRNSGRPIDSQN